MFDQPFFAYRNVTTDKRAVFLEIWKGKVIYVDAINSYSKIRVFVYNASADSIYIYIKIMRNLYTKNQFVYSVTIDSVDSYKQLFTLFILPYVNFLNSVFIL